MSECGSISVVVPVLNERDSLVELHGQLCSVLTALGRTYEVILVDDGSTDGSLSVLRAIQCSDPHVVVIELRRNFGKATALQAGFQLAQGDVIITMDGDLQDDPDEIPRFLEMLEEGFDLVSGWKKNRQDPVTKTLPSRLYNFSTSLLTGIPLRDFNCGFKAYRREVVERLDLYGELHRYIPVLAHAKGFRVGEMAVRHHPRRHGRSKYSSERFLRGPFDLLTVLFLSRFQRRPLHLFGLLGLVVTALGFVIDLYLTNLWFRGVRPIGDRPLLALGTLLITVGIQILVFGLMAEMLTAVTYRRTDVMDLVRKVDRHQCAAEPSTSDEHRPNIAVDQEVGADAEQK
jgi:glycosyltransferase involved in cell wall biosynthesis